MSKMRYIEGLDGQPVPDYRALVNAAADYRADPVSMLEDLNYLQQVATEGVKTTRIDAKGNITESSSPDLKAAIACIGAKHTIINHLQIRAQMQEQHQQTAQPPVLAIVNLTRDHLPAQQETP